MEIKSDSYLQQNMSCYPLWTRGRPPKFGWWDANNCPIQSGIICILPFRIIVKLSNRLFQTKKPRSASPNLEIF